MRVYKKKLPEGVKSEFQITIGRKIKVVNSMYLKDEKKSTKKNTGKKKSK